MNSRFLSLGITALIATAAITPAYAVSPTVANNILLMGFRCVDLPGNTTYIVVNIGQASSYRDGTAPAIITNINDELSTNYGPDWATRTDLQWAVAGSPNTTAGGDPIETLYLSREQAVAGTPDSENLAIRFPSQRQTISSNLSSALGIGIAGGFDDSGVSSFNALIGIQNSSLANNWRTFMGGVGGNGSPGNAGSTGTLDFGWDARGVEATPLKALSLYRFEGADEGSVTPAYLGYFKIESNGNVSFNKPTSAGASYASWATTNAGGQAASQDFDNDGIPNGVEWFMGSSNSGFTANPQIVSGTITWPRATGNAPATSVIVQTSTDLVNWQDTVTGLQSASGPISYAVPSGQPKQFVRLKVTP